MEKYPYSSLNYILYNYKIMFDLKKNSLRCYSGPYTLCLPLTGQFPNHETAGKYLLLKFNFDKNKLTTNHGTRQIILLK